MTEDELKEALSVLSRGGVVAAATETFFGLLADAGRSDAVDRVFRLKARDEAKGVALLLPNREAWSSLVTEVPSFAKALADRFWPGPLTIALEARAGLDARLRVEGTIAVRWAGPSDASRIAQAFGAPLTATSANLAGGAPCSTDAEVAAAFAGSLHENDLLIVRGRAPGGAPSTLVHVTEQRVRFVRLGKITPGDLAGIVPAAALG